MFTHTRKNLYRFRPLGVAGWIDVIASLFFVFQTALALREHAGMASLIPFGLAIVYFGSAAVSFSYIGDIQKFHGISFYLILSGLSNIVLAFLLMMGTNGFGFFLLFITVGCIQLHSSTIKSITSAHA